MRTQQLRFTSALERAVSGRATLETEISPDWLRRPGQVEMGAGWTLAQEVYGALTGLVLPAVMPIRERRRLDIVLTYVDGSKQIVEFDEGQHFTAARLTTLDYYDLVPVAFEVEAWQARCQLLEGRERGGGFAVPRPPLFPDVGGRHRQRAFRDFLADYLPTHMGWHPTARVQDVEIARIDDSALDDEVTRLWESKTTL